MALGDLVYPSFTSTKLSKGIKENTTVTVFMEKYTLALIVINDFNYNV